MPLPTHAIAPAAASSESQSATIAEDAHGNTAIGKVIPVGQEPPPLLELAADAPAESDDVPCCSGGVGGAEYGKRKHRTKSPGICNPDGLRAYQNALQEVRVFRKETMRHLRRAEITVWLGIQGCQGPEGARVSYTRLTTLTGTSRKHIGNAIRSLKRRGLLEILETGRFRPNSSGEFGLASCYRVYPRPEPRLIEKGREAKNTDS